MYKPSRKKLIRNIALANVLIFGNQMIANAAVSDNTGGKDVSNCKISFDSKDTLNPTSIETMPEVMKSGETMSSLMSKLSVMVVNIRYLITLIGDSDISGIGDGTITGAVSALSEVCK